MSRDIVEFFLAVMANWTLLLRSLLFSSPKPSSSVVRARVAPSSWSSVIGGLGEDVLGGGGGGEAKVTAGSDKRLVYVCWVLRGVLRGGRLP